MNVELFKSKWSPRMQVFSLTNSTKFNSTASLSSRFRSLYSISHGRIRRKFEFLILILFNI